MENKCFASAVKLQNIIVATYLLATAVARPENGGMAVTKVAS